MAVGTGSSASARLTLRPTPSTTAGPGRRRDQLGQDPADLAALDQHVVGPLQPGRQPADLLQDVDDGQPGQQRQPGPPGDVDRAWREQDRDGQPAARRRGPPAVQPAPPGDSGARPTARRPRPGLRRTRGRPGPGWSTRCRPRRSARATADCRRWPGVATDGRSGGRPGRSTSGSGYVRSRLRAVSEQIADSDVPPVDEIDIHTAAGKLADLRAPQRRGGPRRLGARRREAARQGQEDRARADRAAARRGLVHRDRRAGPAPLDATSASTRTGRTATASSPATARSTTARSASSARTSRCSAAAWARSTARRSSRSWTWR